MYKIIFNFFVIGLQIVEPVRRSPQHSNFHNFPAQDFVTAEELRMLGLDPSELLPRRDTDTILYSFDIGGEDDEFDDFDEDTDYVEDAYHSDDIYSSRWFNGHEDDGMSSHFRVSFDGFTRPLQIFEYNSANEDSSITSTSNSSANTNNSSNNTNSSNNNTSNSNSENGDDSNFFNITESDDELPLDLSSYDPNRFDTDEGGSYEEYSEGDSIVQNSQDIIYRDSEISDGTSYSEDSSSNSQSSISFLNDTNSSSTDTTTDTSSSN